MKRLIIRFGETKRAFHDLRQGSEILDRAPPAAAEPAADMAESGDKKDHVKEKEEVLAPPEEPLPGDCCGSGCVRCVWDIYYEELEEYNNRLKEKKLLGPGDQDLQPKIANNPSSSSSTS